MTVRICRLISTGRILEMQSIARAGTLIANAVAQGINPSDLIEEVVTPDEYRALMDIHNPPPPPTQDQIDADAAKQYAKLNALKSMTPAQIGSWVDANVTNLATAQDAIKTLAIAVGILARRL